MDFIQDDIRERLLREPEVDEVRIEVVWDPVWTRARIREDARATMRGLGIVAMTVWEVFARKEYEEPLHHVGTVTEDDEDLALVSARSIYDEQPWIEMIIVPRAAIREAIRRMSAEACMASLVGSLADNKAALGRRYAEWAVSAPTLESAVAAAAMAQDELGHARSTYPVLQGARASSATTTGSTAAATGSRCSTTSCPTGPRSSPRTCSSTACSRRSSPPARQLASSRWPSARARSSRRRARTASTPRRGRSGCAARRRARRAASRRLRETWEQAGRWMGPDDDPGFAPRSTRAWSSAAPPHQREQVRAWLAALLDAEGVRSRSTSRRDWSRLGRRDAPVDAADLPVLRRAGRRARRPVGRADHHRASGAASACGSYFEAVREDFDDDSLS